MKRDGQSRIRVEGKKRRKGGQTDRNQNAKGSRPGGKTLGGRDNSTSYQPTLYVLCVYEIVCAATRIVLHTLCICIYYCYCIRYQLGRSRYTDKMGWKLIPSPFISPLTHPVFFSHGLVYSLPSLSLVLCVYVCLYVCMYVCIR
ncbi:hypothetical protein F4859DRAFT_485311 [Xylaria cf. heliscus]|nr:hypothetical protein F4859DRAFT_485311 [Xylaria cf. heliscus]